MQDTLLDRPAADGSDAPPSPPPTVMRSILRVGWPVCLQRFAMSASGLFIFILLGRLTSVDDLAAYGLANTLCNLLGRFLINGLASGLDTLVAQAWGAREFHHVGLYAQRVLLILIVMLCAPLTAIWWFAEPILIALGQPAEVAKRAGLYARISLPALYGMALQIVCTKTFVGIGNSKPILFTSLFMIVTVGGLLFLLCFYFKLGLVGACIARTASTCVQALSLLIWAAADANVGRKCWPGVSRACLRGWRAYLRLGLPACFMMLAEEVAPASNLYHRAAATAVML